MADRRAHAVAPRVAPADDDDVLVGRMDRGPSHLGERLPGVAAVLLRQILHGKMHARQFEPRHAQIAGLAGAHAEQDGIELLPQLGRRDVGAHVDAGLELHALGNHLFQAAVEHGLFQLEVGNAVTQQAAQPVVLLEHDHLVAGAGQLLGGGQSRRPRADDGRLPAGFHFRPQGLDPILGKRPLGNLILDLLDVDGPIVQGQGASRFARSGTDAAGDLGKVVGRVQIGGRFPPAVPIDQFVELGNPVAQGAAHRMAIRDAAVHAAGGLLVQDAIHQRLVDFVPVLDPLLDRTMADLDPRILQKTGGIGH